MVIIQIPIFSTKLFYLLNDIISHILTHSARVAKSADKSPDILAYISLPRSFNRQSWPWMERRSCYTQTEWGPISQRPIFPPEGLFLSLSVLSLLVHSFIFGCLSTHSTVRKQIGFLLSPLFCDLWKRRLLLIPKVQYLALNPDLWLVQPCLPWLSISGVIHKQWTWLSVKCPLLL